MPPISLKNPDVHEFKNIFTPKYILFFDPIFCELTKDPCSFMYPKELWEAPGVLADLTVASRAAAVCVGERGRNPK